MKMISEQWQLDVGQNEEIGKEKHTCLGPNFPESWSSHKHPKHS